MRQIIVDTLRSLQPGESFELTLKAHASPGVASYLKEMDGGALDLSEEDKEKIETIGKNPEPVKITPVLRVQCRTWVPFAAILHNFVTDCRALASA